MSLLSQQNYENHVVSRSRVLFLIKGTTIVSKHKHAFLTYFLILFHLNANIQFGPFMDGNKMFSNAPSSIPLLKLLD